MYFTRNFYKSHLECQFIFDCLPSLPPSADRPSPGLLSHADWSLMLSVVDSSLRLPLSTDPLWDLPFLLYFRSRGRSRAQALCLGFMPKQTKRFSDRCTHTHTPNTTNGHIVSQICLVLIRLSYFKILTRLDSSTGEDGKL